MDGEQTGARDEAAIRAAVDDFVQAIRRKDVDGVMAAFAPDVVSFDLGPPLQHGGGEDFRRRWQALFDAHRGAVDYAVHELDITAGDGVAFSRSLNRNADRRLRWTACWRRTDGRWLIVHEHVSVPVDLHSGAALLDAKPRNR